MSKSAIETILQRHSCRHFTGGGLPEKDLNTLMECLRWSPSAGNLQPWFFYLVESQKGKDSLARAAFRQDFIAEAAVVFVACAEPEASAAIYGERGRSLYCLQDTAAAVENLVLAATALGYGSCWIGAFDEEMARRALDIPRHLRPVAIVPLGPGKAIVRFPGRKAASEIFEFVK
jgi:nitroreductase